MSLWSTYTLAYSIEEALLALASAPGPALPIAGGTDLLLDIQQGNHPPVHTLVDLTAIPELNRLEIRGDWLFIGAAVPLRQVTQSPLIRELALALSEACGLIGGPQVRNSATLGGNVAHALPAADGMIALVAMGAQAEVASLDGLCLKPILNLFKGPGISALEANREILVGFRIPIRHPGEASAFSRVMRPQGVALPIINTAVWLRRAGEVIEDIRIAVGPSGPVPMRGIELENALRGRPWDAAGLAEARALVNSTLHFRSSAQRASADYRYQLCDVLIGDVIGTAWKRAELMELV